MRTKLKCFLKAMPCSYISNSPISAGILSAYDMAHQVVSIIIRSINIIKTVLSKCNLIANLATKNLAWHQKPEIFTGWIIWLVLQLSSFGLLIDYLRLTSSHCTGIIKFISDNPKFERIQSKTILVLEISIVLIIVRHTYIYV